MMIFGENIPDLIVDSMNLELNKSENIYSDLNPDGFLTIKTPVVIEPIYDNSDDEVIIQEVRNILQEQDDYAVYFIGENTDPNEKHWVDSAGTWQSGIGYFLIYASDPKYCVKISRQIIGFNRTEENALGKPPVTPITIGETEFLKFWPFTKMPLNALQVDDGIYLVVYGIAFTIKIGGE